MLTKVQNGNQKSGLGFGASQTVAVRLGRSPAHTESRLARMQSVHGNHGMLRLVSGGVVQRKLTINQPGDVYEREADRVADAVLRMPTPAASPQPITQTDLATGVQRCSCGSSPSGSGQCEECKAKTISLQRVTAGSSQGATAPSIVHEVLRSPGQPLAATTRSFMESRFGHDLSGVRVHTDSKAAESARAVKALAYTVGSDVVFGAGAYEPQSHAGRKLVAHELAHTIQQGPAPAVQRQPAPRKVLAAPRFVGNAQLDRALNNETLIQRGNTGVAVRLIQESLVAQGYTLPGFGIDGNFGRETEAAVKLFQTDAGAKVDGIVGPETMAALDLHDPTNLAGPGPVAKTGPLAGPRPAPSAGCDAPFAGVTFTLANQVASGVAASVAIGVAGGDLVMQGTAPANYQPHVTIHAPTDPKAREFRVGFISNMLSDTVLHTCSSGVRIQSTMPPNIKDGAPLSSGSYDAIFVERLRPRVVQDFTGKADTTNLNWPDTPSEQVSVNLLANAPCHPPLAAATLTHALMIDTFRTWVAVRHMQTGCVKPLHHIDWDINWEATVTMAAGVPTAHAVSTALTVTEANGNGSPAFVQGGPGWCPRDR